MRINNNISAMNTYSRLSSAQSAQSKSLEKLSSGLRINKAGDDAAGLAISEKMRGQIGGLNQAVRNAQDGISLIQTAEGALSETHSILNRMRELAVQSSNDTNTNDDRMEIQKEMNQLSAEVNRIAGTTEFNTQKLLNGEFEDKKFHIGSNNDQSMTLSVENMDSDSLKIQGKVYDAIEVNGTTGIFVRGTSSSSITDIVIKDVAAGAPSETSATINNDTGQIEITLAQSDATTVSATSADVLNALKNLEGKAGIIIETDSTYSSGGVVNEDLTTDVEGSMTSANVDDDASKQMGINVTTQSAANSAISIIDNAIANVSSERSKLGSVQNRLDHTINNLTATSENLTAAESRIRDVDMAKEMMSFTKNNILNQAATAMLAQANQMPQGVLQLLG